MNERDLLFAIAVAAFGVLATSALLWQRVRLDERAAARLREVGRLASAEPVLERAEPLDPAMRWTARSARMLVGTPLLSRRTVADLRDLLIVRGLRGERAPELLLAAKLALALVLSLAMAFGFAALGGEGAALALTALAGSAIGILLPDAAVRRLRRRYLERLEAGLPDGLEMMAICADAGLGLENALARVAEILRSVNPAVAHEFRLTLAQMTLLDDRRQALLSLGERSGLASLQRFSSALAHALQYGTPLVVALRTLAADMRQEALTRMEERAARLPALLAFPVVFLFLPLVVLIVAAPAAISILRT